MLVDIQTAELGVAGYPETEGCVDGLEDDPHGDEREPEAGHDAQTLGAQLAEPTAVEQAVGRSSKRLLAEQADGERSPLIRPPACSSASFWIFFFSFGGSQI